jgi:hypothetical protein
MDDKRIIIYCVTLQVFTTWQLNSSGELLISMLTAPTGLLTMVLALLTIQVLVTGGWLILLPPQIYMLASKDATLLRCYPSGHFESHLLLSMVYVILLVTATATVALLCCSGWVSRLITFFN